VARGSVEQACGAEAGAAIDPTDRTTALGSVPVVRGERRFREGLGFDWVGVRQIICSLSGSCPVLTNPSFT
jgi:hypothetical protein